MALGYVSYQTKHDRELGIHLKLCYDVLLAKQAARVILEPNNLPSLIVRTKYRVHNIEYALKVPRYYSAIWRESCKEYRCDLNSFYDG